MNHNRDDASRRGLVVDAIVPIIDRDVDWHAVRDCHHIGANAARVAAYRDRLAASLDPLGEPEVLARRQLVGLRVQAEMRRRDRLLRLRRRLAPLPTTKAGMAVQGRSNVVCMKQVRQT